ncbi:MAG TPA: AAA family ATPase [Pyrinomonadaceae bacterium]|nr:AAA family ATPase [Pyrinomonadaceae bacterium]
MSTGVEESEKTGTSDDKKSEPLLDSLEIKGYRCFEHLNIEKLGRVNLIVGKNNVGKTAFLEALWIYLNRSQSVLNQILNSRYENQLPISFSGDGTKVSINLFNRNSKDLRFQIGHVNRENRLIAIWKNQSGIVITQSPQNSIKNFFVKTDGLDNSEITSFWDKIELTPKEEDVIKSMKFISPDLLRVRLRNVQDNARIPYAQIKNWEEPVTLRSLGEGLNRLFGISLALVNCKDGVLLIDEIEGGFHYSVLSDVWKLIFKTARDLNVQVFATTHSYDCIEAFAQAAIDDKESDGMLIRLENKSGAIKAVTFSEDELETVTRRNIEVR